MPNRILRESILTSEPVSSLDWAQEVFYRRLMSVVDDYGRCEASPQLLRSRCYPLQVDSVRVADISRWMAACQKAGVILVYEVGGKQFLEVAKFGQQQRTPSKCPAPDPSSESCNHLLAIASKRNHSLANAHLGVVVCGDVVEGVGDSATPVKPAPLASPTFITLTANDGSEVPFTEAQVSEFTALYPSVDVRQQLRNMRAWLISNPSKRKTHGGMARFANSWLAKEQDKGGSGSLFAQPQTAQVLPRRKEFGT